MFDALFDALFDFGPGLINTGPLSQGTLKNFQQMLDNIFQPLFEVTVVGCCKSKPVSTAPGKTCAECSWQSLCLHMPELVLTAPVKTCVECTLQNLC